MAEFKVIETQDELDRIVGDRVQREKDKAKKVEESLKSEIETLQATLKENETKVSEYDKLVNSHKDEVAQLTGQIKSLQLQEIKHRIAHENGLPYELADRLTGDTEELLRKDAEALKGFVTPQKVMPLASTEQPADDPKEAAWKQTVKELTQKI